MEENSGSIHFNFHGSEYTLAKEGSPEHQVKIYGTIYAVLGPSKELEKVCDLMRHLSFSSEPDGKDIQKQLTVLEKRLTEQKKIHEAEDIIVSHPSYAKMKTSREAEEVNEISTLSEKDDLESKSTELWKCVGRTPDPHSRGYIYKFKLREGYSFKSDSKNYPSTHALLYKLLPADEDIRLIERLWGLRELREILSELGYSMEMSDPSSEYIIDLPDSETLNTRWEKLREKHLNFPSLDVKSLEGIADDETFIQKFLWWHDVLLSSGKEYVHDHIQHVVVIISCLTGLRPDIENKFSSLKFKIVKEVIQVREKLNLFQELKDKGKLHLSAEESENFEQGIKKLKGAIGFYVDVFANTPQLYRSHQTLAEFNATSLSSFDDVTAWLNILKDRNWTEGPTISKILQNIDQKLHTWYLQEGSKFMNYNGYTLTINISQFKLIKNTVERAFIYSQIKNIAQSVFSEGNTVVIEINGERKEFTKKTSSEFYKLAEESMKLLKEDPSSPH